MMTFSDLIIVVNGLLLLLGLSFFVYYIYAYAKNEIKKMRVRDQMLIAEIRRRKQVNIQSLYFSQDYDKLLNDILLELESQNGRKK